MTLAEIDQNFRKGTVAWYEAAFAIVAFDQGYETRVERVARVVLAGKARYQKVESITGVPWRLIACIHNMECSCDFRGVLHNGELIVGTGRRTTLVPRGRGPFASWEAAALDALKLDGLANIKDWSIGLELKWAEIFNGTGYLRYHAQENSPYIWGCTTINDGTGKYVADGKYDPNANANAQVGVAAVYKQLQIWGEFGAMKMAS